MPRKVNRRAIYREIANKHGLTVSEVEEAVKSQFYYVKQVMVDGLFEEVRLPYFGRFHVWKKQLQKIQEDAARRHARKNR